MYILANNLATTSNTTVNGVTTAFPKEYMYNNTLIEKTYFDDYIDIDLGSAKNIKAIGLVSEDTGITVSANSSASWGSPPYTTTVTNQVTLIDQTYRYWRIAKSGTNKINYFYLGVYNDHDYQAPNSTPTPNTTDISNASSMGVVNTTHGIYYITQDFSFPIATEAEWELFDDWYQTTDRSNSHLIVPFPLDTPIESYFGIVTTYDPPTRDKSNYSFAFGTRQVK